METPRAMSTAATNANSKAARPGLIRRWLSAWRRLEDAIAQSDYGPYDHVADRVGALEVRFAELEARAKAREQRSAHDR